MFVNLMQPFSDLMAQRENVTPFTLTDDTLKNGRITNPRTEMTRGMEEESGLIEIREYRISKKWKNRTI